VKFIEPKPAPTTVMLDDPVAGALNGDVKEMAGASYVNAAARVPKEDRRNFIAWPLPEESGFAHVTLVTADHETVAHVLEPM
jgi:hypothetical protein